MGIATVSDETVQQMIELLQDPLFCNLRKAADERPILWIDFCSMNVPSHISRRQTWDILNTLRRQTAVELPYADGRGRRGWYSLTRAILDDLDSINRQCHEGSWLDQAIASHNTTYFLVESHIGEAIATLHEDGLNMGYETARSILLNEREPERTEEHLLLNSHRMLWDLGQYDKEPCTPQLIFDIYERVARHAGSQDAPSPMQESRLWKGKNLDSNATLELIANLVNLSETNQDEHPLFLSMAAHHLFMSNLPLPAWNGIVSALVTKLLFRKSHLPVLSFAPITKTLRDWKSGAIQPPEVRVPFENAEVLVGSEVDYTIYVSGLANLVRHKLEDMEKELKQVFERDRAFSHMLRDGLEINHRQRQVLQIALKNPEAIFDIGSHQKAHKVAYATARSDLQGLCDLNFLHCTKRGRAFRYSVVPGLRQLLTGHTRKDEGHPSARTCARTDEQDQPMSSIGAI